MKKETYFCGFCKITYTLTNTEEKAPNGAWIRLYKNKRRAVGTELCYECMRLEKRAKWLSDKQLKDQYKKYEKTPHGFLVRKYRNMKSRVLGIQKLKKHLYLDKDLLSKEEFYQWANSEQYLKMHKTWTDSGYERGLCPTVDRIDSNKGYTLENIRWLTHSENSSLGAINKKNINKIKKAKELESRLN